MAAKTSPIPLERLSAPAQGALIRAGDRTLRRLAKDNDREIAALYGIDPNVLGVLKPELAANGLAFWKDRR